MLDSTPIVTLTKRINSMDKTDNVNIKSPPKCPYINVCPGYAKCVIIYPYCWSSTGDGCDSPICASLPHSEWSEKAICPREVFLCAKVKEFMEKAGLL